MDPRSPCRTLALACVCVGVLFTGRASGQTVADIAARGACSTAGLEGISRQLADSQTCLRPGQFVRFAPHSRITLSSTRVHPYLQARARDAVHRVADGGTSLTINSAFRTLADQYVLYHSGGCGLAARPGRSNHQSGRAIDVSSYASVRSALESAGCAWLGSSDPVHFDCPGSDLRSDAILTFQRLWNANNPGDRISADGLYGPQTESRLGRTPAAGFPSDLCEPTCERHCEGDVLVDADCGRGDCGAFGATCTEDGLGVRCVNVFCPATGEVDVCLDAEQWARCSGGSLGDPVACPVGTSCAGEGECLPVVPADMGAVGPRDGGPAGVDAAASDAALGGTDGGRAAFATATGGCSCRVPPGRSSPAGFALVLLLVAALRRRR